MSIASANQLRAPQSSKVDQPDAKVGADTDGATDMQKQCKGIQAHVERFLLLFLGAPQLFTNLSCYLLQMKGEVKGWDTKDVFKRHVIFKRHGVPLCGVIHTALQFLLWNDL